MVLTEGYILSVQFTRKGWQCMKLGKDFIFIIRLLQILVDVLTNLGKKDNEDTPDGQP